MIHSVLLNGSRIIFILPAGYQDNGTQHELQPTVKQKKMPKRESKTMHKAPVTLKRKRIYFK